MAYRLTNYERETIINFNEQDKTAEVFTYNTALINKLSNLCVTRSGEIRQTEDNKHGGITYEVPKSWVKIVPSRILTEKQRMVIDNMNAKRKSDSMM